MDSLEVIKPVISGCCVVCGTKTRVVCHRCGDFYCSRNCQLNDWQRHRYICFSIPALVHPFECSAFGIMKMPSQLQIQQVCDSTVTADNVNEQKAKLDKNQHEAAPLSATTKSGCEYDKAFKADESVNSAGSSSSSRNKYSNNNSNNGSNYNTSKKTNTKINGLPPCVAMPQSGDIIYITGFRSVNRCFLRVASEHAEKAHSEICRKVNLLGKEMNKIHNPRIFSYGLAKYQDQFYRVKIIPGSCVRLQYLDLGFVKAMGCVEIHEISNEIMQLPCSIVELPLKGVPNVPMSHDVVKFISNFENNRFIIQYGDKRHIDLMHVDTGKSLNVQIIEYCTKLHLPGQAIPPEKKLVSAKSDAHNDLTFKSKMGASTPDISVQDDPPKVESELKTQPTNKPDELINKKEVNISKEQIPTKKPDESINKKEVNIIKEQIPTNKPDQLINKKEVNSIKAQIPVADDEENNKLRSLLGLDKESSDQHQKAKENIPSNVNIDLNTIPPVILDTTKNENATREAAENIKTISNIPTDIKTNEADDQKPSTVIAKSNTEPLLIPPFETRRIAINSPDGVDIFIVDNSNVSRGIIGGFESKYARHFSDLQFRLSQIKDTQPYKPILREYVIAKFEGAWYRAKVMDIKTNQPTHTYDVMYVEFTNVSTVTEQDIRRYPPDLNMPCHTSVCLIEGFPHRPSNAQMTFLQEKLQMHKVLHVDAVNYLQDMAMIKCNALIDALNKIP